MAPPLKAATTVRRSTGTNPNTSALHRVAIGGPNALLQIQSPDAHNSCDKCALAVRAAHQAGIAKRQGTPPLYNAGLHVYRSLVAIVIQIQV